MKCLRRSAWWAPCQTFTWCTGTGRKRRTHSLPSTSKCLTACAISTKLQNSVSGKEIYSNSPTSRYISRHLKIIATALYRQECRLFILSSEDDGWGLTRIVRQNVDVVVVVVTKW